MELNLRDTMLAEVKHTNIDIRKKPQYGNVSISILNTVVSHRAK